METLDAVEIDTASYYSQMDEIEKGHERARDEARAESTQQWLECWAEDPSYLCMKLAKQDGAENQCADVFEAMAGLQTEPKFSPAWLRAAVNFSDGVRAYARQLADEAFPL